MPRRGHAQSAATRVKISRSLKARYAHGRSGKSTVFGGTQKRYTKGVKPQRNVRRLQTGESLGRHQVVHGVPGLGGVRISRTVSESSLSQSRRHGYVPLTEVGGRRGSVRLSVGATFLHDRNKATTLFVPVGGSLLSQKSIGKGYNYKAKSR
jgi:hypothetical protein